MLPDTSERNDALAEAALRSIRENGLQIDSRTFAVWFEYHRGINPGLRRILDIFRTNNSTLTDATIADIHDRFISHSSDYRLVHETADRMAQTLTHLMTLVGEANADASHFGGAVRRASGQFAAKEVSITELVQTLLAEAREIGVRTTRIQSELSRKSELMQSMQRSLEEARRQASTDPLTGLANRRMFEETLQQRAGRAMNDGLDLCLLLFDLDHFKKVNDRWGHPVGDEVLKLAAQMLRANIRDDDLAARYGGEEFALILPDISLFEAATVGERIRAAFAANQVVLRGSGQSIGTVTISAGISAYDAGEPLAGWVARTDAALYRAKQAGRNRLEIDTRAVTLGWRA